MTCPSAVPLPATSPAPGTVSNTRSRNPSDNSSSGASAQSVKARSGDASRQRAAASQANDDAADGVTNTNDKGGTDGDTPVAFGDVIREFTSAATPDKTGAATVNMKPAFRLNSKTQQIGSGLQPVPESATESGGKDADKKVAAKIVPDETHIGAEIDQATPTILAPKRNGQSDSPIASVALDVAAPPLPVKLQAAEEPEFAGTEKTQPQAGPESRAVLQAEPVLTVAIRTPVPTSGTPQAESSENISAVQTGVATTTASASSALAMHVSVTQVPPPESDASRKRLAAGVYAASSEIAPVRDLTPSAPQTPDVPVDAQAPKTTNETTTRSDQPHAPVAATEPPVADQQASQPLRSLALEFTPDGAKDVKVRLSERSGEVHVSLHSNDPAITKSLRDGVTDLASVLSQSGYDAETWTSGGRQQNNQQPRDEPSPSRTRRSSNNEVENFDGILQHPVQEIS